MISELQAIGQNDDVASFLLVFLVVAIGMALIYAVRALRRPADSVRSSAGKASVRSPLRRPQQVTKQSGAGEAPSASPASAAEVMVARISAERHLERAIAPMQSSVARGYRARELHQRASVRLGAADYAFDRMLEELSAVIAFPERSTAAKGFSIPVLPVTAAPISLAA